MPGQKAHHALLVLGMHRSGTSALTRVLSLCGAGLPATLFQAVEGDNDTGYWESTPVIEFHQRLLWRLGTGMLDTTLPPEGWLSSDVGRSAREEATTIALREWGDHPLWVVKEPRICRLVPLWREVLARIDRRVVVVHCLREPAEVAASLARRDGTTPERAELLWLQHVAAAERTTRDLPRVFVRYEDLLADWRRVVATIARLLPGGMLDAAAAAEEVGHFLDPSLRRQHRSSDPPGSDPVRTLRDALFEAARTGDAPDCALVDRSWAAACDGLTAATPR